MTQIQPHAASWESVDMRADNDMPTLTTSRANHQNVCCHEAVSMELDLLSLNGMLRMQLSTTALAVTRQSSDARVQLAVSWLHIRFAVG